MLTKQAILTLSNIFNIDHLRMDHDIPLSQEEYFLDKLQDKVLALLKENGEYYFINYEGIEKVQNALSSLSYSELISLTYGIDYNLELRRKQLYVTKENYGLIFHCLVSLPRHGDEGLKGENHGHGYHLHYVVIKKSKQKRTDVLLTFDPNETKPDNHTLYWETHGGGISRHPDKFGKRRRLAIYSSSCTFLSKVKKSDFKRPGSNSEVLWPQ